MLARQVYGKPLVYLDNAATTQKPRCVIDKITEYYEMYNSNIHRGVHFLSSYATGEYEKSRRKIADFINAADPAEIIFTRGATEAINLVAAGFFERYMKAGDEMVISEMEHHSNFVPWQALAAKYGATLRYAAVTEEGLLDTEHLYSLLNEKTKLVALCHVSNAMGTINPVGEIIRRSHEAGVKVLIDGCQAVQHLEVDVRELDADFYAFSGHKAYGPTGVGVLWGKRELLEELPPYQYGGEMISTVSKEGTEFNELPFKFEAGTPNIEAGVAFQTALEYLENIGISAIAEHEAVLLDELSEGIRSVAGARIIGDNANKTSVVSFVIDGLHHYDIGAILDKMGVAVRTGHHCAQPLMKRFGIEGTVRASLAMYNTKEEINLFSEALGKAVSMLR